MTKNITSARNCAFAETSTTDEPARASFLTKAVLEAAQASPEFPEWQRNAYVGFTERVLSKDFPCYFATTAQRTGKLVYAFAGSVHQHEDIEKVRRSLLAYLAHVKTLSGMDAVMSTLIIFVKVSQGLTVPDCVGLGWGLINRLHEADSEPWPVEIPADPNSPAWAFSFAGVPLFVNMSTPAHLDRKSRNLGEALTLVVQPREGFDQIAPNTQKGLEIRRRIRSRIAAYDSIPPSPELGNYGDPTKREWKQYGLPDDNQPAISACPFHQKETK